MNKFLLNDALASAGGGVMTDCSTDVNPASPDKMNELRKQEWGEKENFNSQDGVPSSGS